MNYDQLLRVPSERWFRVRSPATHVAVGCLLALQNMPAHLEKAMQIQGLPPVDSQGVLVTSLPNPIPLVAARVSYVEESAVWSMFLNRIGPVSQQKGASPEHLYGLYAGDSRGLGELENHIGRQSMPFFWRASAIGEMMSHQGGHDAGVEALYASVASSVLGDL